LSCGQVFKDEIEKSDQPGGPILDPQESKAIFGGLVPIYDVHVKIRDELKEIVATSSSQWPVGTAFLRHVWRSDFLCLFAVMTTTISFYGWQIKQYLRIEKA